VLRGDDDSNSLNPPRSILQAVVDALTDGRVLEAVERFHDRFKFKDHALDLEFTEKKRLIEFFKKSRELFPDVALKIVSLFESGDHAVAEWKVAATRKVPNAWVSVWLPISVYGSTVIRVDQGRIVEWSDYYDRASSRRTSLAAYFTDWHDY